MSGRLTLVLGPTQSTLADYVRSLYPDVAFGRRAVEGQVYYTTVRLTPEEVERQTGLALTAERANGRASEVGRADPFAERIAAPPTPTALVWTGNVAAQRSADTGYARCRPAHHRSLRRCAADRQRRHAAADRHPRRCHAGGSPCAIEERASAQRRLAIQLTPNGRRTALDTLEHAAELAT